MEKNDMPGKNIESQSLNLTGEDLLVIMLNGQEYGIFSETRQVLYRDVPVHKFPMMDSTLIKLCLVQDKTLGVADLAAYLGVTVVESVSSSSIIIYPDRNNSLAGFTIESKVRIIKKSDVKIIPLPEYLKCGDIDKVAVVDNVLIPLINSANVCRRFEEKQFLPDRPGYSIDSYIDPEVQVSGYHLFDCGEDQFALPDSVSVLSVESYKITDMAGLPDYLAGIFLYQDKIIPVMDFARRIGIDSSDEQEMMIADIQGRSFGLLVNKTGSLVNAKETQEHFLPALVQSNWMHKAIYYEKQIVPIVELDHLLSAGLRGKEEKPLPKRYSFSSEFHSEMGKKVVEVTEFSILSMKHAFPKSEIIETMDPIFFTHLPNVLPVVIGIANYKEEFLPVIDLALCFGYKTGISDMSKMVLMQNGDFKALVLVKHVFPDRKVPVEDQKSLPVKIPHEIIYECYLDETRICLILNIEALTLYFDPDKTPILDNSIINQQDIPRKQKLKSKEGPQEPMPSPASLSVKGHDIVQDEEKKVEDNTESKIPEQDRESVSKSIESDTEISKENKPDEKQEYKNNEMSQEEDQGQEKGQEDLIQENVSEEGIDETGLKHIEQEKTDNLSAQAKEDGKENEESENGQEKREQDKNTKPEIESEKEEQEAVWSIWKQDDGESDVPDNREKEGLPSIKGPKRRKPAYILFSILVVVLIIIALVFRSNRAEKIPGFRLVRQADSIEEKQMNKPANKVLENSLPVQKKKKKKNTITPLPVSAKPGAPVPENEIDENRFIKNTTVLSDYTVYSVRKGDTLSDIAKHFTGDWRDFQKIADQNDMTNPHLLFPYQDIRIKE